MSPVVTATKFIGEFEENAPGRRSGIGWGRRAGGGGGGGDAMIISVPRAGKSKAGTGTVAERIMAANGIKPPPGQVPQRPPPLHLPPLPALWQQQQPQPHQGPQPLSGPTGPTCPAVQTPVMAATAAARPAVLAATATAAARPAVVAATAAVPADAEAVPPLALAGAMAAGGGGGSGLMGPSSPRKQRSHKLAAAIEEPHTSGCCSLMGCFRGPRLPTAPSTRPGPARDAAGGPPPAPSARFTPRPSSGRGAGVGISSFRQANHSIKRVPFSARSRSTGPGGNNSLSATATANTGSGRLRGGGSRRLLSGGRTDSAGSGGATDSWGEGSDEEFEELQNFVDDDVDSVLQQSEGNDDVDSLSPSSPNDVAGGGGGGGGGESRSGSTPSVRPAGALLAYRESHRIAPVKSILKSAKPRDSSAGQLGEASSVMLQSELPPVPRNRVVLKHPSHDTDDEDGPGLQPYTASTFGGAAVPTMSMYGHSAPPGFTSTSLNNIPIPSSMLAAPPPVANEGATNGGGGGGDSAEERRSAFAAATVSSSIKLTAEELLGLLVAQGKLTQHDVQQLGITADGRTSSDLPQPPHAAHTASPFALQNLPSLSSAGAGSAGGGGGGGGGGSPNPRISTGGAVASTSTALSASAFPTTPLPARPNGTAATATAAAAEEGFPSCGDNTLILQNPHVRYGGNQPAGWGGGGGSGGGAAFRESASGTAVAATAVMLSIAPSINHRVHFGADGNDPSLVSKAVMDERNGNSNGGGGLGPLGNGTTVGPNATSDASAAQAGTTGWAMYAAQRRPPVPLLTERYDRYGGMGGTINLRGDMGIPGTSSKALQLESCGPSRASSPPTSASATRPNPLPVVPRHLPAADSRRCTAPPMDLLGPGTRGAFAVGGNAGFRATGGSGSEAGTDGVVVDRTVRYCTVVKRSSDSGVIRMVSNIGDDNDGGVRIARSNVRHSYCGNPAAAWAAATAAVVRAGRGSGDGGAAGGGGALAAVGSWGAVELLALRKLQSHMRRSGANRALDDTPSTAAATGAAPPGPRGDRSTGEAKTSDTQGPPGTFAAPLDPRPSKSRSVRYTSTVMFDLPETKEEEQEDWQAAAAAAAAVAAARDRSRQVGDGGPEIRAGGGRRGRESGGGNITGGGGGGDGGLLGLESFGNGGAGG